MIALKKEEKNTTDEGFFLEMNEKDVLRLPISGPIGRRIFVVSQRGSSQENKELFVQRNDAFSTNLFGLLRSIKDREITEIRYSVGFDGLIRILLDEKEELVGEYFCKSENSMKEFKRKMQIK